MLPDWQLCDLIQLVCAAGAGSLVGFLRELKGKPAGTTTITLVTMCATLLMQLSLKLPLNGSGPGDPARLAAAVITGVGFLGAGTIIRRNGHVDGLTSAATIWIMSAVGLAIGASYYVPAGVAVVLVIFGFAVNHRIEQFIVWCRKRLGIRIIDPGSPDDDEPRL